MRSAGSSSWRLAVAEVPPVDPLYTPSELAFLRRRSLLSLMAGVALGSTGHIAAVTVATIVAKDLAGTTVWSGAPSAAVVLGAAFGATLLSRLMASRGRRTGLVLGYAVAVAGALVATLAISGESLPLFMIGILLIGFGNSANLLSRYAAADLYPVARRASAIGLVVWGATFGAVLGPNLVGWAGQLSQGIGLPTLACAYLLPIVFVGGAGLLSFVMLRPDPYALADRSELGAMAERPAGGSSLEALLRRPHVPAVVIALVAGQAVMVLIMTMTPLHMADHGHDLAAIGLVISGHILGMYALSPISGRLTDRFGSAAIVTAGLIVVAFSAILSAVAPPEGGPILFIALFLLGYGWNLGFVAGSALLTHGLAVAERTRLQGLTDALIWSSSAAASIGSGVVVAVAGFTALGILGAAIVVIPAWLVVTRRRSAAVA
jgi:MFS family permease